jgi:outer membrane protein TolC
MSGRPGRPDYWRGEMRLGRTTAIAALALLAGCANFSADGGMRAVSDLTQAELRQPPVALRNAGDAEAAQAAVARLLRRPLTADAAVRIALLNNRDLQASYNALGLSEAALVRQSLPPNPSFKLSSIAGSGESEIERQIALNVLALATLPARAEIAADRFRQAQLEAARETLRVAADARGAFIRAVAARALTELLARAQVAAEDAAKISRRLGETGAATKLDQARNQAFYAELATQLAQARQNETAARERLVRALGLWGRDLAFKLPSALPPLPARIRTLPGVETEAVRHRLDLQIARLEAAALAKSYGLTDATRFLNLLDVGGISKTTHEPDGGTLRQGGIEAEFEIPLFDFGEVRRREAEQRYMQAVNRLVAKAVRVRSEAREAYQRYRSSFEIARHYRREVLPLRKIISDETLLRYNAMQIDVFTLLAEARERIASSIAALDAQRDFFLADNALTRVLAAGSAAEPGEDSPMPTRTAGASAGHD